MIQMKTSITQGLMYRGEVWLVNLDPTVGTGISKKRPISSRCLGWALPTLFYITQRRRGAKEENRGRSPGDF